MKRLQKTLFLLLFMAVICLSSIVGMKAEAANNQILYNVKYGQTEARTMLEMINEFRTGDEAWYWQSDNTTKYVATNLQKVVYDYDLEKIAMQRAAEVAASFSHTRPDGTGCFTCVSNGVSSYGENIAAGTALNTAEKAFVLWQETNEGYAGQGHRRNMLKDGYTAVGIGYAYADGCHFWVQEFSYYKITTTPTKAIDTTQSVNLTIAEDQITSKTLEASTDSITVKEGEMVELPKVTLLLRLEETWPYYRKISSGVAAEWKVKDSSIIRISDGKIYGLKHGTTTISAQSNGMTVSVDIQVDHVKGSEVKENIIESKCETSGFYDSVVYCTVCKEEISRTKTEASEKLGHKYGTTYIIDEKATLTSNGSKFKQCTRSGCSAKTSVKTIYKASGIKLSTASYTYNGKVKSPTVIVKDSKGNTISSSDYTLTKPSGRKNVGKYTYTIKFKNAYSGTKKLTFKINPKGTSISSLTKASKAFTVKWKKQSEKMSSSRITGYQIQYSTSKKFTSPKTVTVSGYSKTSKKITKLTAKKTYYVRIRTYKTVNGTKYYSGWSTAKTVKTK